MASEPRGRMPEWIVPMAATLTQQRFTGPEWVFERKFDGIRLLAFKEGTAIRLLSRNRLPHHLPAIEAAVRGLPHRDLILDGEVTSGGHAYHVFDIVWRDGCDLSGLPLEQRRRVLRELPLEPPLERVAAVDGDAPWERACRSGWEGVIAKRRDSSYEQRRSPLWLKMKCELTGEFTVGGFTDPQGSRVGLGALLVGVRQESSFVYAGKVGTGFDTALLETLRRTFDWLEIASSPFTAATGLPRIRTHWLRPEVRVNVAFIEWTVHRKLRHSRLLEVLA